jgi:RarD protein
VRIASINPLVNVLLGMLFLKERLRRPRALAVLLACAAVVFRTVFYGERPRIALSLAFTFGLYGLIRASQLPSLLASDIQRIYKSRTTPDHGLRRSFFTPC